MKTVITKAASNNYYSPENRARRRKQRKIKKVIRNFISILLIILVVVFIISNFVSNSNANSKENYEMKEEQLVAKIYNTNYEYDEEYCDPDYDPELEEAVQKMLDELTGEQPVLTAEEALPPIETLPSVMTNVTWSEDDYNYLVMVLTGECQTFSYEDQLKVGSVVLNRVNSTKYFKNQNTIKDVCLAPGQYACFDEGGPAYRTPTETTIQAALYLLENGSILPSNVIFQAQFKQGDGVYEQIGNTYLCYKN